MGGEEEAAEEIEEGARLMEMGARWMKITQLWARGGWRWACRSGCAWWVCAGDEVRESCFIAQQYEIKIKFQSAICGSK